MLAARGLDLSARLLVETRVITEPEDHGARVGRGHDVDFWSRFLAALHRVDPDMWVNIEHEDVAFGPLEGLQVAAETLKAANAAVAAV